MDPIDTFMAFLSYVFIALGLTALVLLVAAFIIRVAL